MGRWGTGRAVAFSAALALSFAAACTSGSPPSPTSTTGATPPIAASAQRPAPSVATASRTPLAGTPAVAGSPVPADNRGITFGKPATLGDLNLNSLAVPVTNTTDQVKSFIVRATVRVDAQTTIVATGAVDDLLPKQTRAAVLAAESPLPRQYEAVDVRVGAMVREAATTPGAEVAGKITFARGQLQPLGATATLDVPVRNGDSAPHTLAIQAIYLAGGDLVAVATGGINDLQPGETRTATLLVQGTPVGEPQFAVALVVK